jgi:hypothetical protein
MRNNTLPGIQYQKQRALGLSPFYQVVGCSWIAEKFPAFNVLKCFFQLLSVRRPLRDLGGFQSFEALSLSSIL